MTFSDFIGLNNNIIIHLVVTAVVEVAESSLWHLLLNQTLTPLVLSSLSLETSSSTPCEVYLDIFVQRLKGHSLEIREFRSSS